MGPAVHREELYLVSGEEAGRGDVFVKLRPVHADTIADQAPLIALLGRGLLQAGEPYEGDDDFPAVGEHGLQRGLGERDGDHERADFNG